jgi:signal transduction histidine kinase
VSVDYTVVGSPRPVSQGIGLTAYRIVQEALTNTVKHAAGAGASVTVEFTSGDLRIAVTDSGPGASVADGAGYGLAGLRERVSVYGGELDSGRRAAGGYEVRARLPLGAP